MPPIPSLNSLRLFRTAARHRALTWLLSLAMMPTIATPASSQAPAPAQPCPRTINAAPAPFPSYEHHRLSPDSVARIRQLLSAECWSDALTVYFGEGYDQSFVDWVVYIDREGAVHQGLTKGGREQQEFRGENYVWVIVFSDRTPPIDETARLNLAAKAAASDGELVISRRSINYQRDPLLRGLIKAFTGRFFAEVESSDVSLLADSSRVVPLEQLSADTARDSMLVAQLRYGVAEKSEVVLSVRPADGRTFPGRLRSIYANLGNASPSRWEVGLAGGLSIGSREPIVKEDTIVVGTRSGVQPNLYLTGYLNLKPPRLPWDAWSMGPVVGLNLARGDLFSEIIGGVAMGRVFGELGLILGVRATSTPEVERAAGGDPPGRLQRKEVRRYSGFVGADLRF